MDRDNDDSTQKLLNSVKEISFAGRKEGREKRKFKQRKSFGRDNSAASVKINVDDFSDSSTTN